jgi:hypothetical protein
MITEDSIPTIAGDPNIRGMFVRVAAEIHSNDLKADKNYGEILGQLEQVRSIYMRSDGETTAKSKTINARLAALESRLEEFLGPVDAEKQAIVIAGIQIKAHWRRVGIATAYAFGAAIVLPLVLAVCTLAWHFFSRVFLG